MSDQYHPRGTSRAVAPPVTPAAAMTSAVSAVPGVSTAPTSAADPASAALTLPAQHPLPSPQQAVHQQAVHPQAARPQVTPPLRPPQPWPRPAWARRDDLLDGVVRWGVMHTVHGEFRLQPVRLPRDLPLLVEWMNDPVVSTFWELSGPPELTEHHVQAQLDADGRSVPCLGLLDGTPMSYWEVYRADLDPLARHYPARPHDTGLHLLIGPAAQRGRGLGGALIAALTQRILRQRHACGRVVAEPDVRNLPSVRAFVNAGFRLDSELLLPEKHAALMVHDRAR